MYMRMNTVFVSRYGVKLRSALGIALVVLLVLTPAFSSVASSGATSASPHMAQRVVKVSSSYALGTSSPYVLTPFGYVLRTCVFNVGTGAVIFDNDTVVMANGTRFTKPPCPSEPTQTPPPGSGSSPPASNGWDEDANWCYCPTTPPAISYFDGYWKVPDTPPSNFLTFQLIYLFLGLQPSGSGGSIIQPVLQWGWNGKFGGGYWVIASWYAGSNSFYSTPQNANTADQIYGQMSGSSCSQNTGGCNWLITTTDTSNGHSTSLSYTSHTELGNLAEYWAAVALEVYGVANCAYYPPAGYVPTTFSSMTMKNTNGLAITPSWTKSYPIQDGCYQFVKIVGANQVSLYYGFPKFVTSLASSGATGGGSASGTNFIFNDPDGNWAVLAAPNSGDSAFVDGDFGSTYSGTLRIYGYSYYNTGCGGCGYYSYVTVKVSSDNSHWTQIYGQTWNPSSGGIFTWISIGAVSSVRYVTITTTYNNGFSAKIAINAIDITGYSGNMYG